MALVELTVKTRRCQPKAQAAEEVETRCRGYAGLPKGQSAHKESPVVVEEVHLHSKSDKCLIITIIFFKWACSLWVTLLKPAQPW